MHGRSTIRLTLLESTRRPTLHAVGQELVGTTAYAALVLLSITAANHLNRIAPTPTPDESASFFAPRRQGSPPPAQESVQYIGLGGTNPLPAPAVETKPVSTTAVPPASLGVQAGDVTDQPDASAASAKAYTDVEVDSTVRVDPSSEGPEYPPALLEAGVEGVVYARFVVDSAGQADTTSLAVTDPPAAEFVAAVRRALGRMKYRPAILQGRAVAQLVEQPFVFRIRVP